MGKMNKDDIIQACISRINGETLQAIADRYGVTREYIRQVTPNLGKTRRIRTNVFPNIQKYIDDNHLYLYEFADMIGASHSAVYNWFKGETQPSLYYCQKIVSVTGLDFHTAFALEAKKDGGND